MIVIQNGRVIDPARDIDAVLDLAIANGRIAALGNDVCTDRAAQVIDARGLVVCPGLVDVHVHFRDPGLTYKEDILTGAAAAAKGGFTTVVCMANTKPAVDNIQTLRYVLDKAKQAPIRVHSVAALTKGTQGHELCELEQLAAAGACGFSDDGLPLTDEKMLLAAMHRAKALNLPISLHEEHPALIAQSGVNAGAVASALGLSGAPAAAEDVMVARDCMLALYTGAKVNLQHISSARSVALIRLARSMGADIAAEATPQHFTLTEQAVLTKGTLAKLNPPLRTEQDRLAVVEGLRDGTLNIIATDHAPHTTEEKALPFSDAPSGMIGLETALALGITALVREGHLTLGELIRKMSVNPAALYGFDAGSLAVGAPADITILDPDAAFVAGEYLSKSSNSPFTGTTLFGIVLYTLCGGDVVYKHPQAAVTHSRKAGGTV